jgi:pimeloyl-ACP methyl ester carboxylesterase
MLAVGYATPEKAISALGVPGWGKAVVPVLKTDQGAPPGFMDWWIGQFEIPTVEGICAYTEIICREDFNSGRIMHKIHVPMLLLTPAHSVLVDIEDQKRLARTVEGAQLEIIKGHGHEVYLDQAETCQEKFLGFLGGLNRK